MIWIIAFLFGAFLYFIAGMSIMALFVHIDEIGKALNNLSESLNSAKPALITNTLDLPWTRVVIVLFWPIFGIASLRILV